VIRFIEVISEAEFDPRAGRGAPLQFRLGEVWINENYVVSIREALKYKSLLKEGSLPPDLEPSHTFTSVVTQNGQLTETHVVVGTPSHVASCLNQDTKTLLKG